MAVQAGVMSAEEIVPDCADRRRHARRARTPAHRRRAAGARGPAGHHRRPAPGAPRAADLDDHQRRGPDKKRRAQGGRAVQDQRLLGFAARGNVCQADPPALPGQRSSPASTPPGRPAWARSSSTPCSCAESTTPSPPPCWPGHWTAAMNCASSNRCRSTRTTVDPAGHDHRRGDPRTALGRLRAQFRPAGPRRRPGGTVRSPGPGSRHRRPPAPCSALWASSPPSRSRSARTAAGRASPPRARS